MDAAGFLSCLRDRVPIAAPAAIVVAHPDDETIAAGGSLALFKHLTLVHLTDGAPRSLHDAHAAGYETAEHYAAARRCELRRAMQAAEAAPRCVGLGYPDQEAALHVPAIVAALAAVIAGTALVITHAYEGGHPDHDTCALAVHRSCAAAARPPALLEFPAYHAAADGGWVVQRFLPNGGPGVEIPLDAPALARRQAALACFVTQRPTLRRFDASRELFRPAPNHDFAEPPHRGQLLYERHGWGMTGARWRRLQAGHGSAPARMGTTGGERP